jgi:hypothetical protein
MRGSCRERGSRWRHRERRRTVLVPGVLRRSDNAVPYPPRRLRRLPSPRSRRLGALGRPDNYSRQGRHDEAARCSSGCFPCATTSACSREDYDPKAGRLVGTFPQASSRAPLIDTARTLSTRPRGHTHTMLQVGAAYLPAGGRPAASACRCQTASPARCGGDRGASLFGHRVNLDPVQVVPPSQCSCISLRARLICGGSAKFGSAAVACLTARSAIVAATSVVGSPGVP